MRKFGLVGKHISYSFSRNYFSTKFETENIKNASYENFDIQSVDDFPSILKKNTEIAGLNVTIPYKETIIPFLDKLDKTARKIGAVNTIRVMDSGKLKGYNTDYFGFKKSLKPFLGKQHQKALILGTGGASKAIAFALNELNIDFVYVSSSGKKTAISYEMLDQDWIQSHLIIINCTPLGTFPEIENCPKIPYQFLTENHILYDLIYNPAVTQFLKNGIKKGCTVVNGQRMLELQAEKSWQIWNK
ncbi:MAG: shikimate dehydrogenase [Mangrovimonas sp.]|nr:shikimate dehydrogenase [Mangrovimonas sp.]